MSLFDELALHQKKTPFASSSESMFFTEHAYLLNDSDLWRSYLKPSDSFMTVRANILLRALLNKKRIEKEYLGKIKADRENPSPDHLSVEEYMRNVLSGLPYLVKEGKKIYVPIFPESVNALYSSHYEKLTLPPYKNLLLAYQAMSVDPFDYYGYALFDSYFTRLVAVRKTEKVLACYDYDAESLYFINDQGRLDAKVAFFDKDLKNPSKTHMVKRIEAVADAYLASDRDAFIKALVEGNLISSSLLHHLAGKEIRFETKKEKSGKEDEG